MNDFALQVFFTSPPPWPCLTEPSRKRSVNSRDGWSLEVIQFNLLSNEEIASTAPLIFSEQYSSWKNNSQKGAWCSQGGLIRSENNKTMISIKMYLTVKLTIASFCQACGLQSMWSNISPLEFLLWVRQLWVRGWIESRLLLLGY